MQKKYLYIESENRNELYTILSRFLIYPSKKVIIIVGPKGVGKSSSLIKFSFRKEFRIFYFNLESFQINYEENKKKILKIQLAKLFGVFKQNDEENIKKEIEDYIDKNCKKNCFEFIYKIIELFIKFAKNIKGSYFGFIIDQYSLNYNNNNEYDIHKIINLIDTSDKIKLILSPTINNMFSKEQMNSIFEKCLKINNNFFDIYYFQEFIPKKKFIENILKGSNNKYNIDEFGYLPKNFYDLENTNIDTYKEYLTDNLNNNIKEYYLSNHNNKNKIDMHIEILNLLDIVKSEKLISSVEFKNKISIFPLKYLKIIKYKINSEIIENFSNKIIEYNKKNKNKEKSKNEDILIKYLKLLWNNEENYKYDKIISSNFFIEEKNIEEHINNYIEKDKNTVNIYGNYYENYISSYNNYLDKIEHKYNYIYVYKLDFSINFLESILLGNIYNHIHKENLFFSNILDKGASGGLFELLVGYYIQKKGVFLGEKIEQTIYVTSLVPNNYSILYYSSYNKEINNFKEFKLESKDKKKISFKNTFIKQILFNSKYYDMAILIKLEKTNTYKLIVIQATIRKDKEKRLSKDEHELILRTVKVNLENEFDIFIEEAYFIYVLSKKNGLIEDEETKKDCDDNDIEYIGFDIDAMNPNNKYEINFKKAFITNSFPIHNAASLLAFSNKNKNDELNYLELKSIIDENLKTCNIRQNYFEYIEKLFKNKYSEVKLLSEQFKYFELKLSIFNENKKILDYLTYFSFLIIIENENIYIHFNKETYNCKKDYDKCELKIKQNNKYKILFCFSSIPLKINNKE